MARIFYVVEKANDYVNAHFFKTENEALTYGIAEFPDFDMFDEPMEDDENEVWLHGDKLDFKKGILFSFEEGEAYIQPMDEDEARKYCNDENSSAMFFDGFKKGMYGYLGNGVDGRGFKWEWDGSEINESESKRNVPTFEEFTNTTATITEANSDGTISDDEDELMDDLMGTIEATIDDLIADSRDKAYEIGGGFRGPGNVDRIKKLLVAKVKKMKL
jgi:hypothetical protein